MNATELATEINRLWKRRQDLKDPAYAQAAENLKISMSLPDTGFPVALEYSKVAANMSFALTQEDVKVCVMPENQGLVDWCLSEPTSVEEKNFAQNVSVVQDIAPLSNPALPSTEGGWKIIVLDDVIADIENDSKLVSLFNIASKVLAPNGVIVARVTSFKEGNKSDTCEGVSLSEKIIKKRPRIFERTFLARVDQQEGYRFKETKTSYSITDLHYAAKEARLRPHNGHGLDPEAFCCYIPS